MVIYLPLVHPCFCKYPLHMLHKLTSITLLIPQVGLPREHYFGLSVSPLQVEMAFVHIYQGKVTLLRWMNEYCPMQIHKSDMTMGFLQTSSRYFLTTKKDNANNSKRIIHVRIFLNQELQREKNEKYDWCIAPWRASIQHLSKEKNGTEANVPGQDRTLWKNLIGPCSWHTAVNTLTQSLHILSCFWR